MRGGERSINHLSGEHEDIMLLGGHDGIDDQAAEATGTTCYCDSDHDFKSCIEAIKARKAVVLMRLKRGKLLIDALLSSYGYPLYITRGRDLTLFEAACSSYPSLHSRSVDDVYSPDDLQSLIQLSAFEQHLRIES